MKPTQFYIGVALGVACLVLSIASVAMGQFNQRLQTEAQTQQMEINKGNTSQQIGTNLLREMGQSAVKNEKMKAVLSRNGFNVQVTPEATDASKTDKK
jgi:cell division protein YceG involved in septum cleavage